MIKEREQALRKVLISLDMVVVAFVFFATFLLRKYFPNIYTLDLFPSIEVIKPPTLNVDEYLALYFITGVLWYSMLSLNGLYRPLYFKALQEIIWRVIRSAIFVTIAFGFLAFLLRMQFVSRFFFVFFMLTTSIGILLERLLVFSVMRRVVRKEYSLRRLLIVGTGKRAINVIDKVLAHPEWGYKLVKVVDFDQIVSAGSREIKGAEIVPDPEAMREVLRREGVDEVFFVVPKSMLDRVENYLFVCEDEGIDAAIAMDFFGARNAILHHTDLEGIPLLTFEKIFSQEWQLFIKRIADIVISGLGMIILSPLFILTAILVKLTLGGSVLVSQEIVTLQGKKFTMRKFRSTNKEKDLKGQPFINALGKFLRRFNIDSLPQLFSVFFGKMSLVGPRTISPEELDRYKSWQKIRLSMRPGMICLWQLYHKGEHDFNKQLQSDYDYVDNWSLWLDFKILFGVIIRTILGKGAF